MVQEKNQVSTKLYVANLDFWILNVRYSKGQQLELSDNQAKNLLALGHIRAVSSELNQVNPQLNINNNTAEKLKSTKSAKDGDKNL